MNEEDVKVLEEIKEIWPRSGEIGKDRTNLSVFVTDPSYINFKIFEQWLKGEREKDVIAKNHLSEIARREVKDQYRIFRMLERYLKNRTLYSYFHELQIDQETLDRCTELYFEINEIVMRELVGKKLNKKLQKDLEDISERIKQPQVVCLRQFENLKNIYSLITKQVKEKTSPEDKSGNQTINLIRQTFMISEKLAESYCHYVFVCYHRVDSTDKRLRFLTAKDFEYFAKALQEKWGCEPPWYLELNKKWKEDVHDCKTILNDKEKLDSFRVLVKEQLKKNLHEKKLGELDSRFTSIMKVLLNIGAGVAKSKEFDEIIEVLEEKVVDHFSKMGWDLQEVDYFFDALSYQFGHVEGVKKDRTKQSWTSYLAGIRLCAKQILKRQNE